MSPERSHHSGMIAKGPPGFVTFRSYVLHGHRVIWRARPHRKGLLRRPGKTTVPLWHRPAYNWWTAACFAIGSVLFMLGATLSLLPNPLSAVQIATVFFIGSIPFTLGGFLQNLQAANATDFVPEGEMVKAGWRLLGWRPHDLGWLSTIAQFGGTVAFNFNTFDAIHPSAGWAQQDITIWVPGMIGSVLFLVSGHLAFMETGHGFWSWKPRALDWQIVAVNLLGCVFFMIAAIASYVPEGQVPAWIGEAVNALLWLGAACFLISAGLMMKESRRVTTLGDAAA